MTKHRVIKAQRFQALSELLRVPAFSTLDIYAFGGWVDGESF
jgi:hypothetical protein